MILAPGVFIGHFWSTSVVSPQLLDPERFSRFTLISKEVASPTSCIFTLKPTNSALSADLSKIYADAWMKGVWSIQLKQPQLQIARSYTPLPPTQRADSSANLRFLIRREFEGEVSSYLHRLDLGDTVELRGPYVEFEVPEDIVEVLFVAGGTGIAPALQVAHNLFESHSARQSVPKLHILWANKGKEDSRGGTSNTEQDSAGELRHLKNLFGTIKSSNKNQDPSGLSPSPIVKELEALKEKNNGNITVDYFVDEMGSYITDDVLKEYFARPRKAQAPSFLKEKRLILLSGPEGFIKHYAGPKVWVGREELQGPLGGTLKNISPRGWEIWKL